MKLLRRGSVGWWTALLLATAAALFCALRFVQEVTVLQQSKSFYSNLSDKVLVQASTPNAAAASVPAASKAAAGAGKAAEPVHLSVNFSVLRKNCPAAVAWLTDSGTSLNYPVVQGQDNAYYLSHLSDGTPNKIGAVFLDTDSHADFSDDNNVIYGHNLRTGEMFGGLGQYRQQAYYEAHPTLELLTPAVHYRVVLLAGYVLSGNDHFPLHFGSNAERQQFLRRACAASTFHSSVQAGSERLITFCTCAYDYNNARYALIGKLTTTN